MANERDVKIGTSCRAHRSVSKHMNQYCEIRNDCAHFNSLVFYLTLAFFLVVAVSRSSVHGLPLKCLNCNQRHFLCSLSLSVPPCLFNQFQNVAAILTFIGSRGEWWNWNLAFIKSLWFWFDILNAQVNAGTAAAVTVLDSRSIKMNMQLRQIQRNINRAHYSRTHKPNDLFILSEKFVFLCVCEQLKRCDAYLSVIAKEVISHTDATTLI